MMQPMRIETVAELLSGCWRAAEDATVEQCSGASEEEITFFFRKQFERVVEEASERGSFERAFLIDLDQSFWEFGRFQLEQIARGLIASVNFHRKSHEGRVSGADLGIVLARPNVTRGVGDELRIEREWMRALLAQAKLGIPKGDRHEWGTLTRSQLALVPRHLDYYALLLYRYADRKRARLLPFAWQSCHEHQIGDAVEWLRTDRFPEELDSETVIRRLARGAIGTSAPQVIGDVIDPHNEATDYLEIRITWRPGADPPPLYQRFVAEQPQRAVLRH